MTESILTYIKTALGIDVSYTGFDIPIIMAINSAIMSLSQLGVGLDPDAGFKITDDAAVWSDFIGTAIDIEAVKSYIYLKVRLEFDPPTSSFLVESINHQIDEYAFRLQVLTEPPAV